eukprot:jgi/Mesvir1/3180/Mv16338-RA.1
MGPQGPDDPLNHGIAASFSAGPFEAPCGSTVATDGQAADIPECHTISAVQLLNEESANSPGGGKPHALVAGRTSQQVGVLEPMRGECAEPEANRPNSVADITQGGQDGRTGGVPGSAAGASMESSQHGALEDILGSHRHTKPGELGFTDGFPYGDLRDMDVSPAPREELGVSEMDVEPGLRSGEDTMVREEQGLVDSGVASLQGERSVVYQLMEIRGDTLDGNLVEKVVIPRLELVRLCNDAVPRSCNKNASKIEFGKLDRVEQRCYGVVGHRAGILSLLTKVGALDADAAGRLLEPCPPGIYGVVKRQVVPSGEPASSIDCPCQVIFVVLWPLPTNAFTSISPNDIASTCVRYITQLTRHVFFCFDRAGTLAFPSGDRTRGSERRFIPYRFAEQITQEESFDLGPEWVFGAATLCSQLQSGSYVPAANGAGVQPQMAIVTGARGLAGVVCHVALPPKRIWKCSERLDFDLSAPDTLLHWRDQRNVQLHPDMPVQGKKLLLQSLVRDPAYVQFLSTSLQEEVGVLRKEEECKVKEIKAGLEAKQEEFRQQTMQAFRFRLLSGFPILYHLAVTESELEQTRAEGEACLASVRAEVGNAGELEKLFNDKASILCSANAVGRSCLVAALVACPPGKDIEEGWTDGRKKARRDPLAEAEWLWSMPNRKLEAMSYIAGVRTAAFSYKQAGYPLYSCGGDPARSPEKVQKLLAHLASKRLADALQQAEKSLERELAHGRLSVSQRAKEKSKRISDAYAAKVKSLEYSHLQRLTAAALPANSSAATDKLTVMVRNCQETSTRLLWGKKMLVVLADVEETPEPLVELQVMLFSPAPQQGHQGGPASTCSQAPAVSKVGLARIPASWTVLSSFLMKKGRSLLVMANMPDNAGERAVVDIYNVGVGGQRAFHRAFGRCAELADFDEDTRLLAAYFITRDHMHVQHLISVSRFDEGFKAMESACPQVELGALSGSPELMDLKLLKTQRKVVLLDQGGRVRLYNIQQKAMEREVYECPPYDTFAPTNILVTATGNCVMVVGREGNDAGPAAEQPDSPSDSPSDVPMGFPLQLTPLMLPALHALPPRVVKYRGTCPMLASFSLGGVHEGASLDQFLGVLSASTGTVNMHRIQVHAREQADRIEAVGSNANNASNNGAAQEVTTLEYLFHAYDKFAVVGAAVSEEEGLDRVAMHVAVVLDFDEGDGDQEVSLRLRVERHVASIEQRLFEGCKPGVKSLHLARNLVVLPASAITEAWVPGVTGLQRPAADDVSMGARMQRWLASATETAQHMGFWVRQLICLLPLQIARAEDNAFVLMADGVQLPQQLRNTQEAVEVISFGLLDAVLDSWWGGITVVSSMGKQSTGKSYTLNHMFGTSFQISGARCTDGCWMGLCQVGGVLYVILDFEGLGSFERTEQEDMLLAVFNAAISNFTLFKTELRLDRDLEAMFSRFQSGTGLLKGDERLFKGCFCIVVKDVPDRDVGSVNQEFHTKIAMITRPREGSDGSDNFIKGMYGGEFAVFPFPPLGRPDFYNDLKTLFNVIADRPKQFTAGGGSFSSFMKHLMSKLILKDWTTLEGQEVLNRVQYLAKHLDAAISHGRLSISQADGTLEEEALISVDSGHCIESPELTITMPDGQAGGIPVAQVPDALVVLRDRDQEALIQKLLEVFCKDVEVERPQWEAAFLVFVKAVVVRRCSRVQQWVEANLMRLQGQDGQLDDCAVRFMDEVASKLQVLRNEWQLCGSTCSHCFMSCLLPKSHPAADHTCMGLHTCKCTCWFCEEAAAEEGCTSAVLHKCEEKMGHGGVHCCKQKPHTCQVPCDMAGMLNCNSTCCKKAGHERLPGDGDHVCNSPMHLCGAPCSAGQGGAKLCRGRCQINADKTHTVHKCAEVMCLHGCAVKGCTYTCSSRDHFHHTPLSQLYLVEAGGANESQGAADDHGGLHFCGRDHPCSEPCESEGICRLSVQHVNDVVEEKVFKGARSTFTYKTVAEANGSRESCAIRVPPFKMCHEGPHTHSLDPRVVHTCGDKCPTCLYFCELPFGHAGNHKGAHGMMRTCHWVSDHNDIDVGDRKYVRGETGQAEMCNLFCQAMGQGHTHIMECDADDPNKCTHSARDGRRHETCKYGPDEHIPKDELTHAHYWETIGWHDNCSAAEREVFAKCSHRCGAQEHDEPGKQPSFCELELWHDPASRASVGAGKSVSTDGHVYSCKHRSATGWGYHVVLVLDSSSSMRGRPWQDLLQAVSSFVKERVDNGGQDLVSVVVYSSTANVTCEGIPISNCPMRLPCIGRGTDFAAALTTAAEVMERVHAREGGVYQPLLLFMSDGQCRNGIAEMRQLQARFGPGGLIVYTVGFGSSNFSTLKSLAHTGQGKFQRSVNGIALVNSFAQIASSLSQKASLMPTRPGQLAQQGAAAAASSCQPASLDLRTKWQQLVARNGCPIPAVNELMQLTGLEPIKEEFLAIYNWAVIAKRRGESLQDKRLNVVLLGNPGTGKTTVARLYGRFLVSLGALSGDALEETSGAKLVQGGVDELKKLLEAVEKKGGGVLIIDEAYHLNPDKEMYGRRVLDYLLAEVENKIGTLVVALAGYKSKMEALFEHNEGLPERFPYKFAFEDYGDAELMDMLQKMMRAKFPSPSLKVKGGMDGKPMRILIRRLGQGRGREGFGNARAVSNLWGRVMERQATRVADDDARGISCDDFEFKREDLLGPDARLALANSAAYRALQGMVGMTAVKAAVDGMVKVIETNAEREEREEPLLQVSLNRLFLGNPGTGKTTVAKHYAGILKDLGMLSKGEVIVKGPSDFVGTHLGHSEEKTAAILKSAAGNVLVIDEAYGFFSSGFAGGSGQDLYKQAVVDTIVAKVQNVPGEDMAVLMLGYREQMEEFLTKANPGLARRFALEDAFVFDDYSDDELMQILDHKLDQKGLRSDAPAKAAAISYLAKQRRRPNFGNGGAVENLISAAIIRMNARLAALSPSERVRVQDLLAEDFNPDVANMDSLVHGGDVSSFFTEMVGCEAVRSKLVEYQSTIELARKRGRDPLQDLNLCFRFEGAPGTGKTTVARKMGAIFKSLGILGDARVVEVSATDLIGSYVGQTGPKTRDKLREALDRVLFIDEAYRLSPQHSSFAGEALHEIVDALTKPEFFNKLVVILAGYPREIHELMQANPGLGGRFKEVVLFEDFTPSQCLALLKEKLKGAYALPPGVDEEIKAHFVSLVGASGWANGRDVEGLRKDFQSRAAHRIRSSNADVPADGIIQLERADVFPAFEKLLRERTAYATRQPELAGQAMIPAAWLKGMQSHSPPPGSASRPASLQAKLGDLSNTTDDIQVDDGVCGAVAQRDVGVTDEAWALLLQQQNEEHRRRIAAEEEKRRLELEAKVLAEKLKAEQETRELARLEEELRRLEEAKRAVEAAQREEARRQQRLKELGRCCQGYHWIRISATQYQCAGGSHFASVAELA